MAENTKIEWVDHTASPWHGCAEVHEGCDNCYARTQAKRNPKTLGVWGPDGTRVMSASFAKNCRHWNKSAQERGVIETVFPSICDVFEQWDGPILNAKGERLWHLYQPSGTYVADTGGHADKTPVTMDDLRRDLFALIDECQSLRFLLLTKRPENVRRMWPETRKPCKFEAFTPEAKAVYGEGEQDGILVIKNDFRKNVWILTSVSNPTAHERVISDGFARSAISARMLALRVSSSSLELTL